MPGRVQEWLQGNKGMGLTLSGRPFTLRSHLKTGVAATPGWGETGLYDRQGGDAGRSAPRVTVKSDSKTRPHLEGGEERGAAHRFVEKSTRTHHIRQASLDGA